MHVSPFTRVFLLIFSGPLIWAAHFLAVYVFAALACARNFAHAEWLGIDVVQWAIGGFTLAGVAGVAALILLYRRNMANDTPFVRWTTATLGALSVLAMAWEAVPAYLVPACG